MCSDQKYHNVSDDNTKLKVFYRVMLQSHLEDAVETKDGYFE